MATLLLDVTVPNVENDQIDTVKKEIEALIETKYPRADVEINGDTEYDKEETE